MAINADTNTMPADAIKLMGSIGSISGVKFNTNLKYD